MFALEILRTLTVVEQLGENDANVVTSMRPTGQLSFSKSQLAR